MPPSTIELVCSVHALQLMLQHDHADRPCPTSFYQLGIHAKGHGFARMTLQGT